MAIPLCRLCSFRLFLFFPRVFSAPRILTNALSLLRLSIACSRLRVLLMRSFRETRVETFALLCFRRSDDGPLRSLVDSAMGDKRKEPPLPPVKGDGSVDYDGECALACLLCSPGPVGA